MTISYYDTNKKRFREPVFQKTRAVYKSNRSSENENLDSESMLVDVARLYEEISNLDETILDKITYFVGDPADYTQAAKLLDGISYDLSNIFTNFYGKKDWILQSSYLATTAQNNSSVIIDISGDGDRIVAGYPYWNNTVPYAGRVKVFSLSNGMLTQVGTDILPPQTEQFFDTFGSVVRISKDSTTIAASSWYNNQGYVAVYRWNGSSWTQLGSTIVGTTNGDQFGSSIDISADGNTIAITAPSNDSSGSNAGRVSVYQWNGSSWSIKGAHIYGAAAGDAFGAATRISSNGNILAVTAIGAGGSNDTGSLYIYEWNGSSWSQKGSSIAGQNNNDFFGACLALSSDGLIVASGSPNGDYNGVESGYIKVYEWTGATWSQLGQTIYGEFVNDQIGSSLSIDLSENGLTLVSSSKFNAFYKGRVIAYHYGDGSWEMLGSNIVSPIKTVSPYFGNSVSISSDGELIVASMQNHPNLYCFEYKDIVKTVSIDTTNKLSGKLSRLLNKVSRLENGN